MTPSPGSSPVCPRPSCTCTRSGRPRRGSSPSSPSGIPAGCRATRPPWPSSSCSTTSPTSSTSTCAWSTWSGPRRTCACSPTRWPGRWPRQQIRYAELTVTPYISISDRLAGGGVPGGDRGRAAGRAERDYGLELAWIFDIPADFGIPAAELTASVALDYDVPGLIGFGVGGSERGFPRSMFADQFARARAAGLHSIPHAGETTGPETIWDALESLGAERIEHGISAVRRPATAGPPGRAPDHPRRLPDVQRRAQGGPGPGAAPDPSSSSPPGSR